MLNQNRNPLKQKASRPIDACVVTNFPAEVIEKFACRFVHSEDPVFPLQLAGSHTGSLRPNISPTCDYYYYYYYYYYFIAVGLLLWHNYQADMWSFSLSTTIFHRTLLFIANIPVMVLIVKCVSHSLRTVLFNRGYHGLQCATWLVKSSTVVEWRTTMTSVFSTRSLKSGFLRPCSPKRSNFTQVPVAIV